jgi:hypothetical protein
MLRKLAILIGVAALVAVLVPSSASAAGGCSLQGNAKVTPGLTTTAKAFKFSFGGDLSNCQGTGNVKSGRVGATGTGSGTCASTTGKGTSTVRWNTGQSSSVSFTFSGTGNVLLVQGKITSGLFKGQNVKGPLAFTSSTPPPTACASTGITAFAFSGLLGLGV